MDILEATDGYEHWLRRATAVVEPELRRKHKKMRDAESPFEFFRGTYYWWAAVWSRSSPDLADAPRVLAVGDLHVENYGTWRDTDGRLVWGVNDFDEAADLPYTNDLLRLAVSLRFARDTGEVGFRFAKACGEILRGYRRALDGPPRPFVLEEKNRSIRALAMAGRNAPHKFWAKTAAAPPDPSPVEPTLDVTGVLDRHLPYDTQERVIRFRPGVGVGSLGKQRFLALGKSAGAWVAREAKALTPPSPNWQRGDSDALPSRIEEIVGRAARCADPFYRADGAWVVRRLAPRCRRIELTDLRSARDFYRLYRAMGAEAGNIHRGSAAAVDDVRSDFDRRPADWLAEAARRLDKVVRQGWERWRASGR